MKKLTRITSLFPFDNRHQELVRGINEIIDHINQQTAASTGNSSRTTPNNGEIPFYNDLRKIFINAVDLAHFTKDEERAWKQFKIDYQKIVKKDNPVPSLDKFIKIYEDHLTKASEGHDPYLLKKELFEELNLNGRTTDKENLNDIFMIPVQGGKLIRSNKNAIVHISDFYISKYQVTQKLWYKIMGNNPSHFIISENHPVEQVSWNDIQDFLKKLNARYPGKKFRLPTEAEWEYAARCGAEGTKDEFKYAGSNNLDEVGWYTDNTNDTGTRSVGLKQPNQLGIYDLCGNVWEWCSDWYGDYENTGKTVLNPKGPATGSRRVVRGGGWFSSAGGCRVAYRSGLTPGYRSFSVGFRLASS